MREKGDEGDKEMRETREPEDRRQKGFFIFHFSLFTDTPISPITPPLVQ
jgi:hypothetical protein